MASLSTVSRLWEKSSRRCSLWKVGRQQKHSIKFQPAYQIQKSWGARTSYDNTNKLAVGTKTMNALVTSALRVDTDIVNIGPSSGCKLTPSKDTAKDSVNLSTVPRGREPAPIIWYACAAASNTIEIFIYISSYTLCRADNNRSRPSAVWTYTEMGVESWSRRSCRIPLVKANNKNTGSDFGAQNEVAWLATMLMNQWIWISQNPKEESLSKATPVKLLSTLLKLPVHDTDAKGLLRLVLYQEFPDGRTSQLDITRTATACNTG